MLRLKYEQGLPHRAIARACGVGLGTVSEYCRRARQAGLTWPLPAEWDDAQLEARLFQRVGDVVGVPRPLPDMAWVHQAQAAGGDPAAASPRVSAAGAQRLSLQPILPALPSVGATLAPTMRQVHRAGEKAFVDFSGQRPAIVDIATGELVLVELFVGALGEIGRAHV